MAKSPSDRDVGVRPAFHQGLEPADIAEVVDVEPGKVERIGVRAGVAKLRAASKLKTAGCKSANELAAGAKDCQVRWSNAETSSL